MLPPGLSQLWALVDGLPYPFNRILEGLIILAVVGWIAFKTFKTVPQGEEALKLRLGKVVRHKKGELAGTPKLYAPGRIHILVPWVDNLEKVNNLRRQIEVRESIKVAPYYQFVVVVVANFLAINIEGIRYVVQDLEPYLRGRIMRAIKSCMRSEWQGDGDIDAYEYRVEIAFRKAVDRIVSTVGVELESLDFIAAEDSGMAFARAHIIASGNEVPRPTIEMRPDEDADQYSFEPSVSTELSPIWQHVDSTAIEFGEEQAVYSQPHKQPLWRRLLGIRTVERR